MTTEDKKLKDSIESQKMFFDLLKNPDGGDHNIIIGEDEGDDHDHDSENKDGQAPKVNPEINNEKFKALSKKQKKILHDTRSLGMIYTYKTDLIAQLNAIPKPEPEKIFWIENMLRLIDEEERNPPKDYGWLKVILFIFGIPALILIAATIEKSDIFQKTVNPQKYWRVQVATLEENIYKTKLYIKDWEYSSSKKDKSFSMNYDSLVRKFIIEGKEPKEAKQIASEMIKEIDKVEKETDVKMIKVREQMLEHSYKTLDNYQRQLKQAKNELSKYQ